MPHKTKRKFIDKKKAFTFQLVHRSQKDPLAADDEAPQRVLVPLDESISQHENIQESPDEREMRLSKQRIYGVGFDDDYDYMQHLRQPEKQTAILVPKSNRVTFQEPNEMSHCSHEDMTEVIKDGEKSAAIKIPTVVFASKEEEDIGMLHRAIPPTGPLIEWDPDVVAAMDEDFDYENPENVIEDDFILQATDEIDERNENRSDIGSDEGEENEYYSDDDMGSCDSEDYFANEETRSRFTQYSMSSSVLPRTEHLSILDDQFEKFYETYDDDKIGDLGQVEIDGAVPVDNIAQEDAINMLLGIKNKSPNSNMNLRLKTVPELVEAKDQVEQVESSEESSDDDMIELTKEVPKENWDCESILSTYSNIYNHPKVIQDPPKPIRLSKKTGIPLDTLPTRGVTAKQLRMLDLENEMNDKQFCRNQTISESSNVTSVASNVRRKGETKDEKSARKHVIKEMRRERRMEKKATKVAFRHEKDRQWKEQINIQKNLKGMKIS
ncbi:protein LTV1 homolog [Styela clava]